MRQKQKTLPRVYPHVTCGEQLLKYIRSTWLFRQVGYLVETRLRCVCHGFTLPAIQSPGDCIAPQVSLPIVGQTPLSRRAPLRGPLRKQGLELGLKERFSCFAASQAAQRNSPRLLAEILTFGRAPRGGTRRKLLSLPVEFLAESFLACQPNSSPKELLIIADPPPAFLTELCLIDSQVHPAVASTLEPLCMP